jgi:hypothetical protein
MENGDEASEGGHVDCGGEMERPHSRDTWKSCGSDTWKTTLHVEDQLLLAARDWLKELK